MWRISDGFESFMLDCKARRLKQITLSFYRVRLLNFISYNGDKLVTDVSSDDIRIYMSHLQQRLSDKTAKTYFESLKTMFAYLVREEIINVSPVEKLKPPRVTRVIQPAFTQEQVRKLLKTASNRDRLMIMVALDSALRISSLLQMQWQNVDLTLGTIGVNVKNQRNATSNVGVRVRKELFKLWIERGKPNKGYIWQSQKGGRLSLSGAMAVMQKYSRDLGFHCSWHKCRRTAAIEMLRAGIPLPVLSKALHHSSIRATEIYLDILNSDTSEAHQKFGLIDRL